MISSDLFRRVLVAPSACMDRLSIISGYASAGFARRNIEEIGRSAERTYPCRLDLIVGMISGDGINEKHHKYFKTLCETYRDNFSCRYISSKPPVHSKVYVWSKNERPSLAWIGSANYTHTGFSEDAQGNVLTEVDPADAMSYFLEISQRAVKCDDADVEDQITFYSRASEYGDMSMFESRDLPLTSRGIVPLRSGLNWGVRESRNRDQAYIPVPRAVSKSGFFPARAVKFTIETDDDQFFICCIAQDGGKAIHSTYDNSELGAYFRSRLSVASGELVTRQHLDDYGRDYVTISKISRDRYFLDFSSDK